MFYRDIPVNREVLNREILVNRDFPVSREFPVDRDIPVKIGKMWVFEPNFCKKGPKFPGLKNIPVS